MNTIQLNTSFGSTKVVFGADISQLNDYSANRKIVIVTDKHIYAIYESILKNYSCLLIPRGESSKTLDEISNGAARLLDLGMGRGDLLVGFGGGTVTDYTGFLASVFKRGISFGLIPTTTLAQVDASIGGKNGVNLGNYKNMIGVFAAPEFIFIHSKYNRTLSKQDLLQGYAEAIKHALILDAAYFEMLEENVSGLIAADEAVMMECIQYGAKIKMEVVAADEKEAGIRKKLNFGHTLGHAIEKKLAIPHGHAVSIGMSTSMRISHQLGMLSTPSLEKGIGLIRKFQLPVEHNLEIDEYWGLLIRDKKTIGEEIDFILLKEIGESSIQRMALSELKELLINENEGSGV